MKKKFVLPLIFILILAALAAAVQNLDVPFVPTPREVVDEMLRLAEIKEGDVLYDLGCGDGRIVITAAERFKIRGVGIDLNPVRIQESQENAVKAGVSRQVRFIEGDLFEADISEASVVTLYLLSSVNLRLRPKLFKELKPGTRVVSHDFDMGDWKADREVTVNNDYDYHRVYYWVIPANISGTWKWIEKTASGSRKCQLEVEQTFQNFSGKMKIDQSEALISAPALNGDKLSFYVVFNENGKPVMQKYEGQARGDSIEGLILSGQGTSKNKSVWWAMREPGTRQEIAH